MVHDTHQIVNRNQMTFVRPAAKITHIREIKIHVYA